MPFDDVLAQPLAITTLRRGLSSGRLHHALLFFGPDGVGKELAAFGLACALVCTERKPGPIEGALPEDGCGKCHACERALTVSPQGAPVPMHPDVVVVERGLYPKDVLGRSTDEKVDISVDQVRRVVLERMSLAPHEGRQRLVIIRRAEELSTGAANALLKTLEEPPWHTRFVLLTARPGELLPTIRSRVLPVRFSPLPDEVVVQLLRARGIDDAHAHDAAMLAGGSVEAALARSDEGAAQKRRAAIEELRKASEGSLSTLLAATAAYGNAADDRRELSDHLEALQASDVLELRRLLRESPDDPRVDAALRRWQAAREVIGALDRNANVPLALETGLLRAR